MKYFTKKIWVWFSDNTQRYFNSVSELKEYLISKKKSIVASDVPLEDLEEGV